MWGVVFAFLSALGYGAAQFLIHVGLQGGRVRPAQGLLLNLLAGNVVLLVALAVVWPLAPVQLRWDGLLFFIAAGLMAPLAGRGTIIMAIARIGATRASSLQVIESLFAAPLGLLLLGQPVTAVSLAGILLLVASTFFFLNEKGPQAAEADVADPSLDRQTAGDDLPSPAGSGSRGQGDHRAGVILAVLSGLFFACAGILRQFGMNVVPSALLGASVGSLTALLVTGLRLARSGGWEGLRLVGLRSFSLLALSGLSASVGMVAFFLALQYQGTVAISTALKNMSPLVTFFLALLFLRHRERVTLKLGVLVLAAVCGAVLAAVGRLL